MKIRGILIAFLFPLTLNAQDNTACKDNEPLASYNDPMEAIKAKAVKIAQDRYVRLEARSFLEEDSTKPFSATAVRVGCKLLISNFHVLLANFVTREPIAAIGPGEKERLTEINVKGLTSPHDLIAIESVTAVANLPPIKFAEKNLPGRNGSELVERQQHKRVPEVLLRCPRRKEWLHSPRSTGHSRRIRFRTFQSQGRTGGDCVRQHPAWR